jgi:hypothetical protein
VLAKLTLADDCVDGKFLPKGATILINAYGMHHDETRFPNPDVFDPDHYLGVTKLAPELAAAADYDARDHYGYGPGCRLCPGMHLAERNLFLEISKLLWGFSINPGKDDNRLMLESDVTSDSPFQGATVCPCNVQYQAGGELTVLRSLQVLIILP